jgi:hypothetical protein
MSTLIPNTNTVVSYAYTISSTAGGVLGTLQGFNPSGNRQLERIRGIEFAPLQDTIEIVPGRTDFQMTADRFETYDKSMLEALGFETFEDLTQITDPIDITETLTNPQGNTRTIHYVGVWVNNWSKTIREGTITVTENVTMWATSIRII